MPSGRQTCKEQPFTVTESTDDLYDGGDVITIPVVRITREEYLREAMNFFSHYYGAEATIEDI